MALPCTRLFMFSLKRCSYEGRFSNVKKYCTCAFNNLPKPLSRQSSRTEYLYTLGRRYIGLGPKYDSGPESLPFRKLFKPFAFTICFSGCSFIGAAIWQYENMRTHALNLLKVKPFWEDNRKRGEFRRELHSIWSNQTDGQKIAWGIIAINTVIFLLWKHPAFHPFMMKYFCSNPSSKTVCLPMILSTFSHCSFLHFAANMFVLYSFSSAAASVYGKEQFLAVYLSAGVISSFISYVHKISISKGGFSLGASGALMAILSSVCVQYPDAKLAIVFLPFFTFTAGTALKAILALDTAGVIFGWKLFDHAAHLGGALFGIAYVTHGWKYIWDKRDTIIIKWHELRQETFGR